MNAQTINTVKNVLQMVAPLMIEITVIILTEIVENARNCGPSMSKPPNGQ